MTHQPGPPDPRSDPRMAGGVLRYHTWPHIRPQTTAEHQWQVARILLAIWPEAPRDVLVQALFHDVGEVRTGDLPFPVKRDVPELKRVMDALEEQAWLQMCLPWGVPAPVHLDAPSRLALKVADMLDMWEWGLQEMLMGNQFAELVHERTEEWIIRQREDDLPPGVVGAVNDYMERRVSTWRV